MFGIGSINLLQDTLCLSKLNFLSVLKSQEEQANLCGSKTVTFSWTLFLCAFKLLFEVE